MGDFIGAIATWWAEQGMTLVRNLAIAIIILIIGKIVVGKIETALTASLKKSGKLSELLISFIVNVANKVMWLVVFMIALERVGVSVGPLIAGLGVTGFIIGFAFQETLGNLAAGFMIALNQPFKVGDVVDTGGVLGKIIEMNMMCVTLYTGDNKKITVPNNKIWGNPITNFSALDTRRVDMTVGVSYGADLTKTRDVLMETLKKNELILEEPAITIEVVEMADSSVNFVVRPWCKSADYWAVFWKSNKDMKEALDAADIEIPFPQMDIHLPPNAPPMSA